MWILMVFFLLQSWNCKSFLEYLNKVKTHPCLVEQKAVQPAISAQQSVGLKWYLFAEHNIANARSKCGEVINVVENLKLCRGFYKSSAKRFAEGRSSCTNNHGISLAIELWNAHQRVEAERLLIKL